MKFIIKSLFFLVFTIAIFTAVANNNKAVAGSEACGGANPVCWSTVKVNQYSCATCLDKQNRCAGNTTVICTPGGTECAAYGGPCIIDLCMDPGYVPNCNVFEFPAVCNNTGPGNCSWSANISNCITSGSVCTEFTNLSTLGCCGPGVTTPSPPPPTAPPPTSPPTTPPTTCTISLAPATTTLTIGGTLTGTITATVSCTAAINGVTFSSSNGAVATVNPASPTQDTTSPYTTTVTGLTVGSTTITGTVFSGGVARASATATVNVTSLACTVTTAPATLSLVPGGATGTVSASVTSGLGTATVSSMAFGSYNTAIATVSPASDASNPYSTNVTAVSVGSAAVWATATLSDGRTCQSTAGTDSDITVSAPTCTISLAPATTNLSIGGTTTGTITATVSCTAPVNSVNFATSNGTAVSISPASDTTSPYTTTVTGLAVGSSTITGTVFSGGAARASATATVNVTALTCTVTTAPAVLNLSSGQTGVITASVTGGLGTATVSSMAFGSYNTAIATVSPINDISSPYSTTVSTVSVGSAAVWATATLSDGRTCQSTAATDTDIVISPTCTISLSPAITNLVASGSNGIITATVSCTGAVDGVTFSSSNTGVATVLPVAPTQDTTAPYTTTVTGISAGSSTITGTVYSGGAARASATATVNVATATCTISLSPAVTNLTLGGSDGTITATVSCTAPVTNVTFSSSNSSFVSIVPPTSDTTLPYTITVHGVATGAVTITGTVYIGANAIQSATAIVNATPLSAWFQVEDADITTGGDLMTHVLAGQLFNIAGAGGYQGIPARQGATDLTSANVGASHWLVQNTSMGQKVYDYKSLVSQIPADVIFAALPANVTSANFNSASTYYGYTWYKYSGNGGLPLTINGAVDFTNKKVILLVDSANLVINGPINVTDGQGFFMVLVGKTAGGTMGNITVGAGVGGAPPQAGPNLEGLYLADGSFSDSAGSNQLWVRGSIVSYDPNNGISLLRDLVAGNTTHPAELIEFAPDQILLYPSKLGVRRLNWKEVAP